MAGKPLGIVFFLLILASTFQGFQNVPQFHQKTLKAVAGQNISLPCLVKKGDLKLVGIEWRKNEATKLVVYSPYHGQNLRWPNVSLQIESGEENAMMGSHLRLSEVTGADSGIYRCEITSFPIGSIVLEINVTVTDDIQIACDAGDIVEIPPGGNATIRCAVLVSAHYMWVKDEKLVSEVKHLELWQVTDADAGVYKLTVEAAGKKLQKELIIRVLTATSSSRTDPVTESLNGLIKSAHTSPSLSTRLSEHANWTLTLKADERITSPTFSSSISVTSSPAARSGTKHPSPNSTASTDLITAVFGSTEGMAEDGTRSEPAHLTLQPDNIFAVSTESTVQTILDSPDTIPTERSRSTTAGNGYEGKGDQTKRNFLLSVVIIISLMLLIIVIGFFKMKQVMKKRIDLPPSFRPPPPPVKYIAGRQNEPRMPSFPIGRCDSVQEPCAVKPTINCNVNIYTQ